MSRVKTKLLSCKECGTEVAGKTPPILCDKCKWIYSSCRNCGKEVKDYRHNKHKQKNFCNRVCFFAFKTKQTTETKECMNQNCSNTFLSHYKNPKNFCSRSCSNTYHKTLTGYNDSFKIFSRKCRALTNKIYEENAEIINPNNLPRTLHGVEGGYQIDHIKSLVECFNQNLTPEETCSISNLQMIPWEENLKKQIEFRRNGNNH